MATGTVKWFDVKKGAFEATVPETARAAMDRFVQAVIEWCAAGATEPEVGVQRAGDPGDGLTAGLTRLQLSPKPGGEL